MHELGEVNGAECKACVFDIDTSCWRFFGHALAETKEIRAQAVEQYFNTMDGPDSSRALCAVPEADELHGNAVPVESEGDPRVPLEGFADGSAFNPSVPEL